ncbi:hypothetical protein BCR34DRAFT_631043 [Clohesyomyces aquaticus]|uniref:Uncharacterized protein n=1 Tax=Clohesyomyces aquaticus TaxID=1231657 RepID=A0A1Y1ZBL7_9PLEO|nr:hypothetical protein BCR34DRAFT_631043 [Clohesyomyces aquaticus]
MRNLGTGIEFFATIDGPYYTEKLLVKSRREKFQKFLTLLGTLHLTRTFATILARYARQYKKRDTIAKPSSWVLCISLKGGQCGDAYLSPPKVHTRSKFRCSTGILTNQIGLLVERLVRLFSGRPLNEDHPLASASQVLCVATVGSQKPPSSFNLATMLSGRVPADLLQIGASHAVALVLTSNQDTFGPFSSQAQKTFAARTFGITLSSVLYSIGVVSAPRYPNFLTMWLYDVAITISEPMQFSRTVHLRG